jgi:threonine/homoserine/homoserine lactone efflux protein
VTTVTLGLGARSRHAGALIAIGHGIVEFPLMVIIVLGIGRYFEMTEVRTGIGVAGGAMLILMGLGMFAAARGPVAASAAPSRSGPVVTGILLSAGNPYFLLWWATVGLALATSAAELGLLAFVLFAVLHWLCDLVWLEVLSYASHKGSQITGGRSQRVILAVCGVALLFFGAKFLYGAGADLVGLFGLPWTA